MGSLIMKIKPEKLNKGDTIGVISPAGSLVDGEGIKKAVNYFEAQGFKVKIAPHVEDKKGYLAGEDSCRLSDLEDFFKDDEVNAIFCSRGGYGTFRLLDKIDFDLIRKKPKIFAGYSDITALLLNFIQKSGLITFHSPLFVSDFGGEVVDSYTEENFLKILTGNMKIPYEFENISEYHCINPGKIEGELLGGNLAIISGLAGTPYMPDFSGKILFLEDIAEPLYKIDRMFMQLKLAGVFDNIAGLLFTEFTDEDGDIKGLITELTEGMNIPVGYGFPAGHGAHKTTLPLGVNYFFDSDDFKLQLTENYCK